VAPEYLALIKLWAKKTDLSGESNLFRLSWFGAIARLVDLASMADLQRRSRIHNSQQEFTMKSAMRVGGLSCSLAAVLVGSLLFAQEPKKTEPKADAAKKVQNRLPNNFAKLSLTDEQKKKVFAVQGSYGPKIDDLEAQLQALKDKQQAEVEAVLTPDQLKKLGEIRAETKQKQEAAKAAKAKTADKKPEAEPAKKTDAEKKPAADKKS
jgi:membrane protein involved in colicin uptake